MTTHAEIEEKLAKSTNELWIELGEQLASSQTSLLPRSFPYHELARRWLDSHKDRLAQQICFDPIIQKLLSDQRAQDRVLLASAVLDLISALCIGVSPATVAVLLVKEGLETLCGR